MELQLNHPLEEGIPDLSGNYDAPIVRFVNAMLLNAIHKRASDVHFESYEETCRVRYRIDGVLTEAPSPALTLANRIIARIKILSNLDISERRVPQDGRFNIKTSTNRPIECRVSTCPTVYGEKIVIRLLDPQSVNLDIERLGLEATQKQLFINSIHKPQGLILVTGPTGSGKSLTLYSALNILNKKSVNICTVEDPVEIQISGINQVNINPKAGLTFSNTLRSFLRQDPDIMMVGEIRDLETAEIAISAAQTGHLVLSTLHTNSAVETITRLRNLGIPNYNISSSLKLLVAQRLVRKLCEVCKQQRTDCSSALGFSETETKHTTLYYPTGCAQCTNGYQGRIGLFEMIDVSKVIDHLIASGANSLEIIQTAISEGMRTMYAYGLEKVKQGITTIEELNRVATE